MEVFRVSDYRTRPGKAKYTEVSALMIAHINTLKIPEDAETLWLAFLKQGHKISISGFYRYLRKLADAGAIDKIAASKHKFHYFHRSPSSERTEKQ